MLISPALLDFLEQAIEPIPNVTSLAGTGSGKGPKSGEYFCPKVLLFCSCNNKLFICFFVMFGSRAYTPFQQ